MISAVVAGVAGILIAPVSPLTPVTYTLFVVPALAAAVVGRFQNLVPIVVAGIAIGMLQSEATSLAADHDWLPRSGLSELVPLVVILVALLVVGGRACRCAAGWCASRWAQAPRPRSLAGARPSPGPRSAWSPCVLTAGTWRAAVIGTFIAGGHRAVVRGRHRLRRAGVAGPARAGRHRGVHA